mgnify:CR=1 FL=1
MNRLIVLLFVFCISCVRHDVAKDIGPRIIRSSSSAYPQVNQIKDNQPGVDIQPVFFPEVNYQSILNVDTLES